MTNLAFLDTETTGLDPDLHEVWEVGLILRDNDGTETERQWQIPVDLGRADPIALNVGRFPERRWPNCGDSSSEVADAAVQGLEAGCVVPMIRMAEWAEHFAALTWGAHLVGAVVSFDEERLRRLVRRLGSCPGWHYHLVDVEALAAGYIAGAQAAVHYSLRELARSEAAGAGSATIRACEGPDPEPPWNSGNLSLALGVDPELYERHSALGDARWARALYDAVMAGAK